MQVNQPVRRPGRRGRRRGRDRLGARLPAAAGAGDAAAAPSRPDASASSCTSRSRRTSCSPSCRGARRSSRACSAPTSSASSCPAAPRTSSSSPAGCTTCRARSTSIEYEGRQVAARAFPISIDVDGLRRAGALRGGRSPAPSGSARSSATPTRSSSASTGSTTPRGSASGSPRSRSCSRTASLEAPSTVMVQVATPSRERVEHYVHMREQIEQQVGHINGVFGSIAGPAVHYFNQSMPARGARRALPRRRRHARDAVPRRHEPRRQGVRRRARRPRRRARAVRVRRRRRRAQAGVPGQPARHRRA